MAVGRSSVDPWLEHELARAQMLLERGDAASCLRRLREADRVAVAQGYPQVRPLIAELSREASLALGTLPGTRPAGARGVAPVVPPGATESRPHPASSAHPNVRTLGLIWAAVLAAGLVLAAVLTAFDDGPHTDESAAAGALAAIVGIGLTLVYVVVSVALDARRRHPSWWVVGALFLAGIVAGGTAPVLGVSDAFVAPAVWVLIGVYVVGSRMLRHD